MIFSHFFFTKKKNMSKRPGARCALREMATICDVIFCELRGNHVLFFLIYNEQMGGGGASQSIKKSTVLRLVGNYTVDNQVVFCTVQTMGFQRLVDPFPLRLSFLNGNYFPLSLP